MKKFGLLIIFLLAQAAFSQPVDYTPAEFDSIELLLSKTKDPMKRFGLLEQFGDGFYSQRNNRGKEVKYKMEMVQLALALKNDPLISVSYNKLANYYLFTTGDFDTGTQYLYKVIPHAENTGDKDILASVYVDLANAFWFLGNQREQFQNIQKAEANLPPVGSTRYDYYSLQIEAGYSLYYVTMNQPDKALVHTNKAEIINQRVKSQLFGFFGIIQHGAIEQKNGDLAMVRTYFEKAKRLNQTDIPVGNFFFNYFYVDFLLADYDYPQALIQSQELLDIGEKANNPYYELTANSFFKKNL
jgi:tetratricopeptide (TPR) repeat protein